MLHSETDGIPEHIKHVFTSSDHLNRVLRAIRNINQLITHARDRETLLESVCACLTETRGYFNAWIALLDDDRRLVSSYRSGLDDAFQPMLEKLRAGDLPRCATETLRTGEVVVTEDPAAACVGCPLATLYGGCGAMTVRLSHDEHVYGILCVSVPVELTSETEERKLFAEAAADVAFGLRSMESEEERRRAEASLRKSRELAESVIEASPIAITQVDTDGVIVDANRRAEMLLGLERSEVGSRTYNAPEWEITDLDGDPFPNEELPFVRVMATGKSVFGVEHAILLPNGSRRLLRINGTPLHDEGGHIHRVVFAMQDITETREEQEALRIRNQALASSINAIVLADLDGRLTYANDAFLRMWGYEEEEILGRSALEFWVQPGKAGEIMDEVLEYDGAVGELTAKRKDDSLFIAQLSASLVRDKDEKPLCLMASFVDVTDFKQAEAKSRERGELLHDIVENSSNLFYSHTPDHSLTYVSPQVKDILGFEPEEAMVRWTELVTDHPVNRRGLEITERAVATGTRQPPYELQLRHKSGRLVWAEIRECPVVEDGRTIAVVGSVTDITERKRAEEALQESEARFRGMFESSPFGIALHELVFDESGRPVDYVIEDANPAYERILGISREDSVGRAATEVYKVSEAPYLSVYAEVASAGEASSFEVEFMPMGKTFSISIFALSKSRFATIFEDVTDRKQIEDALREHEQELRAALHIARLGPWTLDIEAEEVVFSQSLQRILDIDPPDGRMDMRKAVLMTHPEDRERWRTGMRAAVASGEPYTDTTRVMRSDGEHLWFRTETDRVECDADGKPIRLFGISQDITEQKRLEERLRQMEKMEAVGKIAGGVAHDFNNQLAGIMGYADMLSSNLDDPDHKRYATNILTAARRSADFVKHLLAFARKGKYKHERTDLHLLIAEVVDILRHTIDPRITVEQNLRADPPVTTGDPSQIQNAVLNLALNARDAMPDGGRLTFETDIVRLDEVFCAGLPFEVAPGDFVCLSVSDTGVGMDAQTQEHVFEPFFTTKDVGKGTGMGLAAVYGTVTSHGGAVLVRSKPGHGSMFCMYLPLAEEADSADEEEKQDIPTVSPARILVVDDEAIFRDLAADILAAHGHTVKTKTNGRSAVEYFEKHASEIDLVLLDMIMPKMNGADAFRAMKEIDPDVTVVIASGYSMDGAARDLLAEGVRGIIQKPFTRAELLQAVAAVLKQSDSDQDA